MNIGEFNKYSADRYQLYLPVILLSSDQYFQKGKKMGQVQKKSKGVGKTNKTKPLQIHKNLRNAERTVRAQ